MRGALSRFRYEVVALGLALFFAVVHAVTAARPPEGLDVVDRKKSFTDGLAGAVQLAEGRATDFKFRLRGDRKPHPDVLVLELDERGAQKWGLWPWSRDVLARVIENLVAADVGAIGFDVAFTDASNDPNRSGRRLVTVLNSLSGLPPELSRFKAELEADLPPDPDVALAEAFRKGGDRIVQGVIAYTEGDPISPKERSRHAKLLEPRMIRKSGLYEVPKSLDVWTQYSVQTPLDTLAAPENAFGHFSMTTDADGVIRRMAILAKLTGMDSGLLPAMSLQAAAVKLKAKVEPAFPRGTTSELLGARLTLPDGNSSMVPMPYNAPYMLINYPGPSSVYQRLSVVDAYENNAAMKAANVTGKVVLVGVTIVGSSGDQRESPYKMEPGVFTHAAVVSNILSGDYLDRPFSLLGVELIGMLVVALVFARFVPRLKNFGLKALLIAAVIALWLGLDFFGFTQGRLFSTFVPLLSNLSVAVAVIFLGYLSVDREKLKMRSTFSRYLGEDVVEIAIANPERLNKGEKRDMTVLFSDIRGFTSLSERMSPEVLASFINEYLSPMTQIVFEEKGTLDKYIGDAVMAFWNAPLDQPDHALRGCRAAVQMLKKLEELKAGWRARGYPDLEIGIGLNTGPMVVGNMGSDVRVDYTVLGDAVNLGARLEGTNKEYETRIIISEFTWAKAKDGISSRRLGAVRVKGKRQPVGIYELRGIGKPEGAEATAILEFEKGLVAFTARRFAEARGHFTQALAAWPGDYPTRSYLEECEEFEKTPPPPDWDGVVSLKTK